MGFLIDFEFRSTNGKDWLRDTKDESPRGKLLKVEMLRDVLWEVKTSSHPMEYISVTGASIPPQRSIWRKPSICTTHAGFREVRIESHEASLGNPSGNELEGFRSWRYHLPGSNIKASMHSIPLSDIVYASGA